MQVGYHMAGGASKLTKFKLGAATANAGVPVVGGATTAVGVAIASATDWSGVFGLAIDQATYSSTQGDAEGIISVDVRPDLVVRALMSGGATEGTALTTLTNTSASAGGTVVTSASVSTNDRDGGLTWCTSGNNVGLSRSITAYSSATSITVTVPFPRAIAVGDTFLDVPYNLAGTGGAGADGPAWVTGSTLLTQVNADAAAAAGGEAYITDLELNGASNSYVLFMFRLHAYASVALAS